MKKLTEQKNLTELLKEQIEETYLQKSVEKMCFILSGIDFASLEREYAKACERAKTPLTKSVFFSRIDDGGDKLFNGQEMKAGDDAIATPSYVDVLNASVDVDCIGLLEDSLGIPFLRNEAWGGEERSGGNIVETIGFKAGGMVIAAYSYHSLVARHYVNI